MEFYDVNFSYIDNETFEEHYVSVLEQGGGKLIPEGMCNPGQVYTVAPGKSGMLGVFRLESQMLPGSGKFERTGLGSDRECREASNTAFSYLKANGSRISGTMMKVDELANSLQVCLDSGAKKVLLPITSAADLGTVPPELIGCFNLIFYNSAEDAVYKALGVE